MVRWLLGCVLLGASALAQEANPLVHGPKVNQVGYFPGEQAAFTILEQDAPRVSEFQVVGPDGMSQFAGHLPPVAMDERASCGERVYSVPFTAPREAGAYRIEVGEQVSPIFMVTPDVYGPLYRDAARAFYLIRSGTAIDDPVTQIAHKASHLNDALVQQPDGAWVQRDLVGGWYNAGDYGKWTHMASITCSYMMLLHEIAPDIAKRKLDIPESANDLPDLLDQARWGLAWLLKMQNPDGSVMHKVDSGHNFIFGKLPEDDPNERRATFASTIDAADFTAVMLQATRVFGNIDPPFARQCRSAADRSRAWLEKNPAVLHDDPFYVDKDPSGERLWALAEIIRATGNREALEEFRKTAGQRPLSAVSWMSPEMLGYVSLAMAEDIDPETRQLALRSLRILADGILLKVGASGYGVAASSDEYYWGSLENVLHRGAALACVDHLTGDTKYRDGALRQLGYALGRNSLGFSFVTGYGSLSAKRPFHWTHAATGKVMPGWAAGGPNSQGQGVDPILKAIQDRGTPPAKCFVDDHSWGCHEGQTTENAALLFLAGYLSAEEPAALAKDPRP